MIVIPTRTTGSVWFDSNLASTKDLFLRSPWNRAHGRKDGQRLKQCSRFCFFQFDWMQTVCAIIIDSKNSFELNEQQWLWPVSLWKWMLSFTQSSDTGSLSIITIIFIMIIIDGKWSNIVIQISHVAKWQTKVALFCVIPDTLTYKRCYLFQPLG